MPLKFTPCSNSPGPCSHPTASAKLAPRFSLMPGQVYQIGVVIELPGSPSNQVEKKFLWWINEIYPSARNVLFLGCGNVPFLFEGAQPQV